MKLAAASLLVALLVPAGAQAVVIGGSNLSVMGYPDPDCDKPYSKPHKPYSFNNQWEVDAYNREVDRYNDELRRYNACAIEYLENAENDIKRIRESMDGLVREAQRGY